MAKLVRMDVEVGAGGGALAAPLARAEQSARRYAAASRSTATERAYRTELRTFAAWCEANGQVAMPATPQTIALYLAARADEGLAVSTLGKALAAIRQAHRHCAPSPCDHPEVKRLWRGIRRTRGTAAKPKAPVLVDDLRAMVAALPDTLAGLRDRALLVVGLAGAFRRSELVALDVEDLQWDRQGVRVFVRRSKADQEGAGAVVGLPFGKDASTCPVRALSAWLEAAGVEEGALFCAVDRWGNVGDRLTGQDVARAVKRAAKAAGLDPAKVAGHSLRSGLATQAAQQGASLDAIMRQGRWASAQTVLTRYIRPATVFENNAAGKIGL